MSSINSISNLQHCQQNSLVGHIKNWCHFDVTIVPWFQFEQGPSQHTVDERNSASVEVGSFFPLFTGFIRTIPGGWEGNFLNHQQYLNLYNMSFSHHFSPHFLQHFVFSPFRVLPAANPTGQSRNQWEILWICTRPDGIFFWGVVFSGGHLKGKKQKELDSTDIQVLQQFASLEKHISLTKKRLPQKLMELIMIKAFFDSPFGCFPKMVGFPNLHPKCWSFFSRKTNQWLLGKPTILGNPPFLEIDILGHAAALPAPIPFPPWCWNLIQMHCTGPRGDPHLLGDKKFGETPCLCKSFKNISYPKKKYHHQIDCLKSYVNNIYWYNNINNKYD